MASFTVFTVLMPNYSIVYDSFSKMAPVAKEEITERMQTKKP